MMLEDHESMLIEEKKKKEILTHKRVWGFEKALHKRGVRSGK